MLTRIGEFRAAVPFITPHNDPALDWFIAIAIELQTGAAPWNICYWAAWKGYDASKTLNNNN